MYPAPSSRTSLRLAAAAAGLSLLAVPLVGAPASARTAEVPWFCTQHPVDTSRLPHTADAVAGWFASCTTLAPRHDRQRDPATASLLRHRHRPPAV